MGGCGMMDPRNGAECAAVLRRHLLGNLRRPGAEVPAPPAPLLLRGRFGPRTPRRLAAPPRPPLSLPPSLTHSHSRPPARPVFLAATHPATGASRVGPRPPVRHQPRRRTPGGPCRRRRPSRPAGPSAPSPPSPHPPPLPLPPTFRSGTPRRRSGLAVGPLSSGVCICLCVWLAVSLSLRLCLSVLLSLYMCVSDGCSALTTGPRRRAGLQGWEQKVDESGRTYYQNAALKATQWEPPSANVFGSVERVDRSGASTVDVGSGTLEQIASASLGVVDPAFKGWGNSIQVRPPLRACWAGLQGERVPRWLEVS